MESKEKYLLMTAIGENNIGILKYTDEVNIETLELCLREHFDLDIKVESIIEYSLHPLSFIAKCRRVEYDGTIDLFDVELDETWLY